MYAASTGAHTGWYVAFERGPDDITVGSNFHRWGSAWIKTLDASHWSEGAWWSTDAHAVADAIKRAGWQGAAGLVVFNRL
jgi:hypothetical protein